MLCLFSCLCKNLRSYAFAKQAPFIREETLSSHYLSSLFQNTTLMNWSHAPTLDSINSCCSPFLHCRRILSILLLGDSCAHIEYIREYWFSLAFLTLFWNSINLISKAYFLGQTYVNCRLVQQMTFISFLNLLLNTIIFRNRNTHWLYVREKNTINIVYQILQLPSFPTNLLQKAYLWTS